MQWEAMWPGNRNKERMKKQARSPKINKPSLQFGFTHDPEYSTVNKVNLIGLFFFFCNQKARDKYIRAII